MLAHSRHSYRTADIRAAVEAHRTDMHAEETGRDVVEIEDDE